MTADTTPTESMIGYDGDGIPPRHTDPAARQHTDQHESTTRIIAPGKLLPPVPVVEHGLSGGTRPAISQAEILRASGYESPTARPYYAHVQGHDGESCEMCGSESWMNCLCRLPVEPRDLNALDKLLEPLRAHRCRGCACALRPDQPCGSYCQRCNEELASLESDCTSAWWSLPAWVLIAALAALGLAEVVVGVAWWWGSK